mmetsp:Transcript_115208/g.325538  ORF Transcript_115208/g.325538 Transcript_115208/m.325538 type:complete len:186 (+) Transcript_115208:107-664(+)
MQARHGGAESEEEGGGEPEDELEEGESEESSEGSSEGSGADAKGRLPSADAAFASVGEASLQFKKFAAAKAKERRVRAHSMSMDRVMSVSSATLRGQGWQPTAAAKEAALPPDEGGSGAAPGAGDVASSGGEKRPAQDSEKGRGKGGMTIKEKTKMKRFKGQSGEDHSGRMWKPETMMQFRAEFD